MNACSDRRRNLNIYATFLQKHLIISRSSRLVFVTVMLSEIASFKLIWLHLSANRHKTNVDEVGAASTAQMRMREAVNHVFIIIVARARVPSDHLLRFRTQLHHALRHRGARESTPAQRARLIGLRPDERIDKFSVIIGLRKHQNRQKQSQNQCKISFHSD